MTYKDTIKGKYYYYYYSDDSLLIGKCIDSGTFKANAIWENKKEYYADGYFGLHDSIEEIYDQENIDYLEYCISLNKFVSRKEFRKLYKSKSKPTLINNYSIF